MTGAIWALLSGVGFGIFQTYNRRAVQGMDVYVATFLQLLVSVLVLMLATAFTVGMITIRSLTFAAILFFAIAGALHFFIGWTFFNASQKSVGAARTTSLIGTTPIFAAIFAAITLSEIPTAGSIIAILVIVVGVYLVNAVKLKRESAIRIEAGTMVDGASLALDDKASGLRSMRFGLAAAICWSLSPTFIRLGLEEVPNPLLGVTVGMIASALGYAVVLAFRGRRGEVGPVGMDAIGYKLFAAVLVGLATWSRWVALDLAPVAAVLALSLVSVPIVNLLSPLVSGRDLENVTVQTWMGSGLIVGGSLLLIFGL